ncbi:MAG: DUF1285 domain-containing protein [Bradymonadaceae bacterium]|nr:DUF1285 domain-containing protein [Lujinxingiaceae bacterium]
MTHQPIDPSLPEAVKKFLAAGATLEKIHLDALGHWTHEGMGFTNEKIIALFNRSVGRTSGGTWVLNVGQFTYPIEVEDTGFFIERVDLDQSPPLLSLSDGSSEPLDPATLRYEAGSRLYCDVKGGEFRARFKRPAYHALLDDAFEQDGAIVIIVAGQTVRLADTDALED